jgi:Protein of unknown function (DUF998)
MCPNKIVGFNKNLRVLSILGITCPVIFVILDIFTRILGNKLDFVGIPLSELALGRYGWLGSLCFVMLAITLSVFTLAISITLPRGKLYKTILVIFFIVSVCFFMAAFIKTDTNHQAWSVHRIIHEITVSAGAGLFTIGCFIFSANIKQDKQWGSLFGFTTTSACIDLFVTGSRMFVLTYWPLLGLQELILLSSGLIWMAVISFKNLKISGGRIFSSPSGHPPKSDP